MSADPQQQIDITPYKVIRENTITSNQQKLPEVRSQSTDLATSILDKLTEIKDNLYPSHLNIPPQKFGQPTGYISPLPGSVNNLNPSQAIEHPADGLETLLRKDTYVSSIPNSRDHSPDIKSPGSPFYFPSPGHSKTHQHGDLSADLNHDLAHAIQENFNKKTAMELRSGSNSPILFTGQNTLTPPRIKSPISNTQNIITASINEDLYRANRFDPGFNYTSQGGSPGLKADNPDPLRESYPSTAFNSRGQVGEVTKSGVGSNLQGEIASNSNYSLPQFSSTDVRSSLQSQANNKNEPRQEYSQQRSDLLANVNRAQATFGYNQSKSPANTLASSPAKGNPSGSNNGSPSQEDSYIIAENKANRAVNSQQQQQQYLNVSIPNSRPQAEGDDISQPQSIGSLPQSRIESVPESSSTRTSQFRSSNSQRDQDNYDSSRPQGSQRQDDQRENPGVQQGSTRSSQVRPSERDNYDSSRPQRSQEDNHRENTQGSTRNSQVRSSKQGRDSYEVNNQDEEESSQPHFAGSQNKRENAGEGSTRNSQVRSSRGERENYEQTNYDSSRPQRSHQDEQRENTQGSTRSSQVRPSERDNYDSSRPQRSREDDQRENTQGSTRNFQVRSSNRQYDQNEVDDFQGPSPQNRVPETSSNRNSQVRSNKQGRDSYDEANQGEVQRRENAAVENTSTRNSQVRSTKGRDSYEEANYDPSRPQRSREDEQRENTQGSTRNSQVRSNKQGRESYEETNYDSSRPQGSQRQDDQRENITTQGSIRNSKQRDQQQDISEQTNQYASRPPRYQQDDQEDSGSFTQTQTQQKQRPEQQNKRHNNDEDTEVTPKQRADTPSDNGRKPEEMTLQSRRQKEAEANLEASKRRSENVADKARQMEKIQELEEMMAQSRKKSQNEPGHSKRRSESHYENLKLQDGIPSKRRGENADTSEQGSMISKYRSETPSEYSNPGDLSQRSQYGKSEQTTPRKSKKADDQYYEDNNFVKNKPELQQQHSQQGFSSQDNTPKNQLEAQQKPQGRIVSNRVGANAEQGSAVSKQNVRQNEERTPQGTTVPLDPQALDKRFSFGLVVTDISERESGPDTDSDRKFYLSKQAEEHARNLGVTENLKKKSGYTRGPNTSEDQEQLSNRLENSSKANTQREEPEEIDERQESQEDNSQDYREQIIQEEKQFRKERRGHRQNQRPRDQPENEPLQDQPQTQSKRVESNRSSRVQKIPESLPEESNEESISSSSKIKADENAAADQSDVKQRNFTFVSRTSGTESSQQLVNNTLSSSAHKMDTDRGLNSERSNQPNDSVVVVEKKKPTRPTTASISPPRRQGGDFVVVGGGGAAGGGGKMTGYITLEHDKKSKSTKTQPSSLNNLNENDSKVQEAQQTMNRNSSQMNLSTPNNQTGKRPALDNLSPPNITLQVPASGMGTRQHSPMHNMHNFHQNMQNMQSPNGMNPLNPMHPMMGGQMGQHPMFAMSNMSSIPNISNMHTPTGMNMNNMGFPNMPNMPIPMPNFNEGGHAGEYQKYILMMMNYYENHLGNMKTMVVQQNEVLNQEKQKNQGLEHRNSELVKKITELDASIKEQYTTFENSQKELKTRYEVVLDELSNVKKGLAARQVADSNEGHAPRPVQVGDVNYQTMLYHEIISLRKDLDNQRQTMYDYRSTSRHLEDQMRDLERHYLDEVKNNAQLAHKREQIQDTLDKYKTDYLKMDTLNKIILDGYERTRKDFQELKSTTHLGGQAEDTNDYDSNNNREQIDSALNSRERSRQPSVGYNVNNEDRKREVLLRSISPLRYEAEDNKEEMLRNKMRAQESQVKDLLQWNANSSSKGSVVYTQTYPTPQNYNQQQQQHHYPQQMGHQRGNPIVQQSTNPITQGQNYQMYTSSSQAYGAGNFNSNPRQQQQQQHNSNPRGQQQRPQPPQGMMDQRGAGPGGRGNVTFPSYQKIEDNKDEIQRIDYELSRLTQHRKIIENELFKMPSTAKSLDQKRKKAALEMELEGIDYQIEDCKNKLRKYDVLTVKV